MFAGVCVSRDIEKVNPSLSALQQDVFYQADVRERLPGRPRRRRGVHAPDRVGRGVPAPRGLRVHPLGTHQPILLL